MPVSNLQALVANRVAAIREYHKDICIPRAQLDVSGGIDSAVMLGLLSRALGPENITAVYSAINSSAESSTRAREVAKTFGVSLCVVAATGAYNVLLGSAEEALRAAGYDMAEIRERVAADATIEGSLRSTLRAPLGRFMNRLTGGGIRHGTGNECEDRWLRFYQKGGDGEVDCNPMAMLSKGEVFQLGRALEVPRSILTAIPTPDLWGTGEAHNDEDELSRLTGLDWTYSKVDPDTGDYTFVGTIERMSRFLDSYADGILFTIDEWTGDTVTLGGGIFENQTDHLTVDWSKLVKRAEPYFPNFECEQIVAFLKSTEAVEKATRHKWNPNCPTLCKDGRLGFVNAHILTNELPNL